jgi:hypothetical protein
MFSLKASIPAVDSNSIYTSSHSYNVTMQNNIDVNGTILLLAIFARKMTKKKAYTFFKGYAMKTVKKIKY